MQAQEKTIGKQVQERLGRAEARDAEEDRRYGKDRRGDELPEERARRETRRPRLREAQQTLEERARQRAEAEGQAPEAASPEPRSHPTSPTPSRGS